MSRVLLLLAVLMFSGCATSKAPLKKDASSFALPEIEGRIEAAVDRVTLGGAPHVWIGVIVTCPERFAGKTVVFRFRDAHDRNFRLLDANRGRSVKARAGDGMGEVAGDEIRFVSGRRPRFTLLKEPNQSSEPMPGLRPAAAHL